MNRQEIHFHFHLDTFSNQSEIVVNSDSQADQLTKPGHPTDKRGKRTLVHENIRKSVAENLWRRFMYRPFVESINPWMNYKATQIADEACQSVEFAGAEMDEINRVKRAKKSYASTRGTIVTPEDLTEIMIEQGLRLAEDRNINRGLMEMYLEYNVGILAEVWALKDETASQLKARIYQRELKLAS